jgi:hypothetical protein
VSRKAKEYDYTTRINTAYNTLKPMKKITKLSEDLLNTDNKAIITYLLHIHRGRNIFLMKPAGMLYGTSFSGKNLNWCSRSCTFWHLYKPVAMGLQCTLLANM